MRHSWQARLVLTPDAQRSLSACAEHYGRVGRTLFGLLVRGEDPDRIGPQFMSRHGLTERQFQAISVSMRGLIGKLIITRARRIRRLEARISRIEASGEGQAGAARHRQRRCVGAMRTRLESLRRDLAAGNLRVCFGGRRLFRAQFNLAANGYRDHADWKRDWVMARSREYFVTAAKSDPSGTARCRLKHLGAGRFSVMLRLPETPRTHVRRPPETYTVFQAHLSAGAQAIRRAYEDGGVIGLRFEQERSGWHLELSAGAEVSPEPLPEGEAEERIPASRAPSHGGAPFHGGAHPPAPAAGWSCPLS